MQGVKRRCGLLPSRSRERTYGKGAFTRRMSTGTGTSRGRRETPRTKKCMDCRQGVPQGDRKEASEPRGSLPPGTLLGSDFKKGDRFAAAVSYNHMSTTGTFIQSHPECTLIFYMPLKLPFS